MDNSFFNICDKFLRLNRICVNTSDLKKQLYSRDSYPALSAFTDVLSVLDIEHRALKIGWEQLVQYGTPVMLHYQDGIPRFVVATRVSQDEISYYKSNLTKKTESRDSFLKHWNGVALYVVEPDSFSWKCYFQDLFKRYRMLLLLVATCLLLTSFSWVRPLEVDPYLYGSFILKIAGLLFSIFLLRHDWGTRSVAERHFCALTKAFSCDAVLHSKASKLFGLIKMSDIGMVYFSGGLTCVLFSFYGVADVQQVQDVLTLLSFCSFPYILFSLSYQRFRIKKWCPLCLGVLSILVLEIVMGVFRVGDGFHLPSYYYCYTIVLFFLVLALAWNLLNSFIKAYLKIEEKELNYLALKRNGAVLRSMLDRQPALEMFFSEGDILIGNRNNPAMVTIAINPFCMPCLDLYEQLRDLQNRFPEAFCLNIRFMSMEEKALNKQIGLSLVSLYYQDKNLFIEALDFWKKNRNFEMFQKRFGEIHFSDMARQELSKHFEWRKQIDLSHTPAIFLGNRKFPEIYTNEDLVYFLEYGMF